MYNREFNSWLSGFLELGNEKQWDKITNHCIKAHIDLVKEVCENHFTITNSYIWRNIMEMTWEELENLIIPLDNYSEQECLYFLQGYFEISRCKDNLNRDQICKICDVLCSNEDGLNPYLQFLYVTLESADDFETEELQKDLNGFFLHDIDPSYPGFSENNEKWLEIHNTYKYITERNGTVNEIDGKTSKKD